MPEKVIEQILAVRFGNSAADAVFVVLHQRPDPLYRGDSFTSSLLPRHRADTIPRLPRHHVRVRPARGDSSRFYGG